MGLAVNNQRLCTKVGGVVGLLIIAATAFVILVGDIHWHDGTRFHVYFTHTGTLKEGGEVQVAGHVVGEISSMHLVPARTIKDPDHPLYGVGGISVDVRLDTRWAYKVPHNGEFFVSTKGLFGEGYLEVGAPAGGAAIDRTITDGDGVRGADPPRVDRVLLRTYRNLVTTRAFMRAVAPEARELMAAVDKLSVSLAAMEPEPGAFARLRNSVKGLRRETASFLAKWDTGDVTMEDFSRLTARARATFAHMDNSITDLRGRIEHLASELKRLRAAAPKDLRKRFDLALEKTNHSLAKLKRIVATARELNAMITRGEGNIGGLSNDPEFSDYAKTIGKVLKRQPWKTFGTVRE